MQRLFVSTAVKVRRDGHGGEKEGSKEEWRVHAQTGPDQPDRLHTTGTPVQSSAFSFIPLDCETTATTESMNEID